MPAVPSTWHTVDTWSTPTDQRHRSHPIWLLIDFQKARLVSKARTSSSVQCQLCGRSLELIGCPLDMLQRSVLWIRTSVDTPVNIVTLWEQFLRLWSYLRCYSVICLAYFCLLIFVDISIWIDFSLSLSLFFSPFFLRNRIFQDHLARLEQPTVAQVTIREAWARSVMPWIIFSLLLTMRPQLLIPQGRISFLFFF